LSSDEPSVTNSVGESSGSNVFQARDIHGDVHLHGAAERGWPYGFDAATLSAFNPHVVATRIIEVADSSHQDVVHLLATADVDAAAAVMSVLVSDGEALAVSLLVEMSKVKAEQIIGTMPEAPPWLEDLPSAADEIPACRRANRARLGDQAGPIRRASDSLRHSHGYWQAYAHGHIYWSRRRLGDAQVTAGPWYQRSDVDATWGKIGEYHELAGGTGGWLGFPVTDEIFVESDGGTPGWFQYFEGGAIFHVESAESAIAVDATIADFHRGRGGASGRIGFPVSESENVRSQYGTAGGRQLFEGSWPYQNPAYGAIFYTSGYVARLVSAGIGMLHEDLGGVDGWLGFPRTDEINEGEPNGELTRCYQKFEGGSIFWTREHNVAPVSKVVDQLLFGLDVGIRTKLGYPVTFEFNVSSGSDDRLQYFENGVVTTRDGVAEAWLRP
jgi:hypothetical protein